jgi:hypothetical protein
LHGLRFALSSSSLQIAIRLPISFRLIGKSTQTKRGIVRRKAYIEFLNPYPYLPSTSGASRVQEGRGRSKANIQFVHQGKE